LFNVKKKNNEQFFQ